MNTDKNEEANLDQEIKAMRDRISQKQKSDGEDLSDNNKRLGLRAGTELVAAIGLSAWIGYIIDQKFDTKPVFLVALLILGIITGFVNVWRTTQGISSAVGLGQQEKEKQ